MVPGRRQFLLLGLGIAVLAVALSVALDVIVGFGDWRVSAVLLLSMAMLMFVLFAARPGTITPSIGDAQEFHLEVMARSASEHGFAEHQPGTSRVVWLIPVLPIFGAIVLIALLG